jgi:hypothetical protein
MLEWPNFRHNEYRNNMSEEFRFRPGQFRIITGLILLAPIQVNCTVLCIAL